MSNPMPEIIKDCKVTYTVEKDGKFFVVENVPARVNQETGEQLFSPKTVEKIQDLLRGDQTPYRTMETPVYQF
jgi:hypothetical protein